MAVDERLVDLLIRAEESKQRGQTFAVEDLCPESPELWPDLRRLLRGLGRMDRLMPTDVRGGDPADWPVSCASEESLAAASMIGRYRVIRPLGRGGYGRVYLAHDAELDRRVAIKLPDPGRILDPDEVEAYLDEARALARLDHPNIVPVYDVGRLQGGLCYIVSKYVDGSGLAARLRCGRMTWREAAGLVADLAGALHYAHTRGLVHRDVKPANILIDGDGRPCLVDFGLALKDDDYGRAGAFAGTPRYMSPEQARGEGHRVDGRSDIFSLGIVFYEAMTGRRPFRGETRAAVLDEIISAEARPPRQIDDTIPRELERICQKMLAKRVTERYTTAHDLVDDLRHMLRARTKAGDGGRAGAVVRGRRARGPGEGATGGERAPCDRGRHAPVIPKGLRSFDRHDAGFFLDLIPGPRDRDGLPEVLRFWKTRVESTNPAATFKVGLIYGPSGCGKSSMVRAGLLPRLAGHVVALDVDADPDETEARLRGAVAQAFPGPGRGTDLVEDLAALRRGRGAPAGGKVLLVIDQFEQWLFSRRGDPGGELISALRQCDGARVQAIVLVRDDFWLGAARFMRDLEVRLREGDNCALVDLFDPSHARKVLATFGRSYGALPRDERDLAPEQREFLDRSVSGLVQDGKVVPVHLSLFAETIKSRPWTPATLRAMGGAQGVGVTFLEETLGASRAPAKHRCHRAAAAAVLKALLPPAGSDIKGQVRSEAELCQAAGYAGRREDFVDLIRLLDPELRLITPTDGQGSGVVVGTSTVEGGRYFQLTHDYLVPSLRDWLTRRQRETRRGRAELRLAERAELWGVRPENRHLPTAWEWAGIRLLTRRRDWSDAQGRMMIRAGRYHARRGLAAALLGVVAAWGAAEGYSALQAGARVESLRTAATADVPALTRQLGPYRRWADPRLRRIVRESDGRGRERLHASLALLEVDASQVEFLAGRLLAAPVGVLPILRDALEPHRGRLVPGLWAELQGAAPGEDRLLRAAAALARYDPGNPRWTGAGAGAKVGRALLMENPLVLGPWLDALRPVHGRLAGPLSAIFRDGHETETTRALAADILADCARDDVRLLAGLLMDADAKADRSLFPAVERHREEAVAIFRGEIAGGADSRGGEGRTRRRARAAAALARLGHEDEVWPLLGHAADPALRSYLVNWLGAGNAGAKAVADELMRRDALAVRRPSTPAPDMTVVLFDPDTSIRRALILILGLDGAGALAPGERDRLVGELLHLYEHDPDSGIHGAADWTLRRGGQAARLVEIDARLRDVRRADRRWYLDAQGRAFAKIRGPVEFPMGSPPEEKDRDPDETSHRRRIPRGFAIAAKEVSVLEYREFLDQNPMICRLAIDKYSPELSCPANRITWYEAAAYCNWLSRTEGLPECYRRNDAGEYDEGMVIKPDALALGGYRLPTEAEWEYACRAGAATSRYYGASAELLATYAWSQDNSSDRTWPCGSLLPNDLGLFDMLGNLFEWCHDAYRAYPAGEGSGMVTDGEHRPIRVVAGMPMASRSLSFNNYRGGVRSASRNSDAPWSRSLGFGFRPARTLLD